MHSIQSYSGGISGHAAPALSGFALDRTLGVPNTVLVAAAIVLVAWIVVNRSATGRRFVAVGASPAAARVAGVRVRAHVIGAYAASGLLAALAGVLLAGFVLTPGPDVGAPYLLLTIAAVVVGGTALTGGRGNLVGTAIGALFLTQLVQAVLTMGAPSSVQYLIQSAAIATAVVVGEVPWRRLLAGMRAGGASEPAG